MKSKFAKRLSAMILSLMMCLGLMGTSALAATFESATEIMPANGTGDDGKIVVTVYNNTPDSSAGTGAETPVSDADPVDGVGINALRIGSVVELTSTDENSNVSTQVAFGLSGNICTLLGLSTDNAIASQTDSSTTTYYFKPTTVQDALKSAPQAEIEAYLDNNDSGATNEVTGTDPDENGIATFDNLRYGLYLLAKSSLPADATTDLVPFLVSVPMYVESNEGDAWKSTVYAYPKVRTGDVTISKTVNDQDTTDYVDGDIYVNAGQTLKYTVTTTIPASQSESGTGSANKFTKFVITDTNDDKTLAVGTDSIEVKLDGVALDKPVYQDDTTFVSDDYEVKYENGVFTITLTNSGLDKINSEMTDAQTLTVTYEATVATNVPFSTRLTNTAEATYQRAGMTESAKATVAANASNTVDLYTYGLDLTKTLSDKEPITENKISFELYDDNMDKILVTSAAGGKSGYWVAAHEETSPVVMYVGTSGSLNLYGLEPGTYYLKETATMEGYTLLDEPITIVITATDSQQGGDPTVTATVNTAAAQVTNGVVSLSVENTRNAAGFTLPVTGDTGTLLVTAIGLGLLCAGIILLVVYRRKQKKNC